MIINFVDNTRNLYNLIELRGFVIVVSVVVILTQRHGETEFFFTQRNKETMSLGSGRYREQLKLLFNKGHKEF